MRKILVTGLCTLHWGRLQYGNVGNYYIVEPLFRLLKKRFTGYEIVTTFQMTEEFVESESVCVVPLSYYYSWSENDLELAKYEEKISRFPSNNVEKTEYIDLIEECEYIINVSGDMWGDNAEHVGHNRFLVDCYKMKTAQNLGKKTILYAVTPGPFTENYGLAKTVFEGFSKVVIREKISFTNLIKWGIDITNVVWAPCPSYLFEGEVPKKSKWLSLISDIKKKSMVAGMTFGGFNMPEGPYDMWPRSEAQYARFMDLVEYMIEEQNLSIVIFSHTNGFKLPPEFNLINGRDFTILEFFYRLIIKKHPEYTDRILLIDEPLLPKNLKSIIGLFDLLVTGRVHASVAATSQMVPTVYIEYDRNVIYSDKMLGFSSQLEMEEYVCTPDNASEMKTAVKACVDNNEKIHRKLEQVVPEIKRLAEEAVMEL